MKNENNLSNSQRKLAIEELDSRIEIQKALAFAMQRCDSLDLNALKTSSDIYVEFGKKLDLKDIMTGIRRGGLGYYGVYYKLTTNVIAHWIHQYIKSQK